jgi:hypothetical protein
MESYSECHWPGGQLRVSTLNFMVESDFRHPKDKSWSLFDSLVVVQKPARFLTLLLPTSALVAMAVSLSALDFTIPSRPPMKKASALRKTA